MQIKDERTKPEPGAQLSQAAMTKPSGELSQAAMTKSSGQSSQASLPEAFLKRMQALMSDLEYDMFLKSYEKERAYGLRRNPLKLTKEAFEQMMPFPLRPVAWAESGYYCPQEKQPGRHVLHEAGAYYIQEPSAMAVAEVMLTGMAETPEELRLLDLCAAPGGKTTQLAGWMQGQGLLVANEIVPSRARILSQNIERLGVRNCVVLNEDSGKMAESFPLFFDGILVDAPCSGEGMFRKDEAARIEWSKEQVLVCRDRQRMILENAHRMLKPGGRLVYSTCTFSPEENEGIVAWFLTMHPEYVLQELPAIAGIENGHPDWVDMDEASSLHLEYTSRLWPHKLEGEGHFFACLIKKKEDDRTVYPKVSASFSKEAETMWHQFEKDVLKETLSGIPVQFGEHLYLVPDTMRSLHGLKAERPGLEIGELKKNRLQPAHALAMTLKPDEVINAVALDEADALRYLKGESLPANGQSGWVLMTYGGCSLGWAKAAGGILKNHYPKGLRIRS